MFPIALSDIYLVSDGLFVNCIVKKFRSGSGITGLG